MEIKFSKLDYTQKDKDGNEVKCISQGILPDKSSSCTTGFDLYSTRITNELDNSGKLVLVYHTDLSVEMPEGYVGIITMKPNIAERSISMCDSVKLIDSNFKGELNASFKITTDCIPTVYQKGEAFAQMIIVPVVSQVEAIMKNETNTTTNTNTENKQSVENNTEVQN